VNNGYKYGKIVPVWDSRMKQIEPIAADYVYSFMA
jgi:hypothetical protein